MAEVLNRSGEDAERRSPEERGKALANTYAKSKEKRTLLESAGSATIPGFRYVDLMRGLYGEDQVSALEAEIARREARATMEPPRPATKPAPFSEAVRPTSTETGESSNEKKMSKKGVKKAIALGLIGATAAGAAGGAVVGGYLAHGGADGLPLSYELHGSLENEDAEAMEQAESIDVSDQYAGHFANDEGTGYNERKSSRYSYGESLEGAEHDEVMKELEHIVFHEPTLFAPLYFDLDDSAKLQFTLEDGTTIDTSTMSPAQLADLMKNEEAHRIMAQHYLLTIGQEYEDTLLNGPHANVYGEKYGDGQIFSSENVRAVHCVTNENNSPAITFRYEIPGKSGQYATTTLRLGCGLQVVRPEKEAERIITSTPEIDPDKPDTPDKPDKPDEPGGGDEEEQGKTPFTEEQVFENEDSPETTNWDHDTSGPGSVGEKPTTSSSTEDMNGGGNTGAKPESSSSQKPATQEQQSASQETSSQRSEAASQQAQKQAEQEKKQAEVQQQTTQKQETHQESVRQQSDNVVEEHTDSNGNVDLDALLDMD